MDIIHKLEELGYVFNNEKMTYLCTKDKPPPEARELLNELANRKYEAMAYLSRRNCIPSHTRTSEQLCTSITKGIKAGESPYVLLLQAIECIAYMTDNSTFYRMNYDAIKSVYGEGLLNAVPLEMELSEVRGRIALLMRPELDALPEGSNRNIKAAVVAHREREARIVEMMSRSE